PRPGLDIVVAAPTPDPQSKGAQPEAALPVDLRLGDDAVGKAIVRRKFLPTCAIPTRDTRRGTRQQSSAGVECQHGLDPARLEPRMRGVVHGECGRTRCAYEHMVAASHPQ